MDVTPIYYPERDGKMQVACFMSGSGTNAKKIIERSLLDDANYEVSLIFTDVKDNRMKKDRSKICKAKEIATRHGIAYECIDIRDYYKNKGIKRTNLSIRPEFDKLVVDRIEPYDIDVIALAGYMSITTYPLLNRYQGQILNVHPADLTIMDGKDRKYVGIHVVRDAILAGEEKIRASVHVVREKVDYGEILMLSKPVFIELPVGVSLDELKKDRRKLRKVVSKYQNKLKEIGDWIIYPCTLQMIANGRFSLDNRGNVYLDGEKLSNKYYDNLLFD
jgi:folate-dependent phosphoribosylglycinamide formyltransferase PurN